MKIKCELNENKMRKKLRENKKNMRKKKSKFKDRQ